MHKLALIFLFVLAFVSYEVSAQPYKTLVAPINKDTSTSLYSITLNSNEKYVIDINAPFLWFICPFPSPPVPCSSLECIQGRTYLSGLCSSSNNIYIHGRCTCTVTPVNPVTKTCAPAQLTYKDLIISWTNGKNPTNVIKFNRLSVSCAPKSLLQSLPRGTNGIAGLSWAPLALSTQLTPSNHGLTKKFAICLPSASGARGVVFFGDGPYYLMSRTQLDVRSILSYTPLLKRDNSQEYFIGVKGISVNGKPTKIPPVAFEFDSLGHGGVQLSSVVPYTTLRSDIYRSFLYEFSMATRGIPRAKNVSPFDLCLKTNNATGWSPVGLRVPQIDLELGNGKKWTIFGANSMKQISNDVACLAFVDGGKAAQRAVVIGSYQIENNFLLFDLASSTLGFSSSLLLSRTTCGNFNFNYGVGA
ncbi:hypothetical protein P3X46_006090 [Hevea brasiliensis]|uniref:Peptidase A1 domain-containing protein n=1 Tax=Hevea brasiliensis TaxID=3981 RepID=A0ABQ9MP37_HEVBR|nr:chitinase CLP-like [Hevea brasiliensis]KAJ9182057.1 hypothetical protein P3X46_006090 [Hevea brasiliensis]